jgi:hypothetical protein
VNELISRLSRRPFWTRKELAELLDTTASTIGRNEQQLGLDKAKFQVTPRLVRYTSSIVAAELKRRGAWPPT